MSSPHAPLRASAPRQGHPMGATGTDGCPVSQNHALEGSKRARWPCRITSHAPSHILPFVSLWPRVASAQRLRRINLHACGTLVQTLGPARAPGAARHPRGGPRNAQVCLLCAAVASAAPWRAAAPVPSRFCLGGLTDTSLCALRPLSVARRASHGSAAGAPRSVKVILLCGPTTSRNDLS